MTREQYLTLKRENKERASWLRAMKRVLREDISNAVTGKIPRSGMRTTQSEVSNMQKAFRVNHIFLCLLRGRTRKEIEANFAVQLPVNGLYSWIENELTNLAESYDLDWDSDENHKVISIKAKVVTSAA